MSAINLGRWALVAATAMALGCGGSTLTTVNDDAGGGEDAGNADGGGGGGACPSSPPTAGAACPDVGLQCEYGSNANESCNEVFECNPANSAGEGAWSMTQGQTCTTGACPSSYGTVPVNVDCASDGLVCAYAQGTCICSNGGGPVRAGGPAWSCFPAQAGCPSPRPDLGTPCTDEGLSCDYGSCFGGIAIVCKGSTWQEQLTACPALASGG